ncbi:MAG: efflux RND transporter periplasmic adaptor subunit [Thermoanaerobaculales bacterium]|nr:efflux RND transporter periplasmic adaptor subunit [Thermoanaerobaculales bacterium]
MRFSQSARIVDFGFMATVLLASWGCHGPVEQHLTEHGETDEHAEGVVTLDAGDLSELGIRVEVAGSGTVELTTELPGEVQVNGDRMAHVAPRVGGVVKEVFASLGDPVLEGQVLAVLESRELADSKADFLATAERLKLADATFRREERLWNEKISSEQDYLDARRGLAEARIARRAAEQKLHALGFSKTDLDGLSEQHDATFTVYRLTAPFDGTVIDRHITIGETVEAGSPVLTVADLKTVWIDLSVYQRDIGAIKKGQTVRVATEHGEEEELVIDFVQPIVGEDTRTATARIVAPNTGGSWHPGCCVSAAVTTSATESAVVVPPSAVISMEDGDEVIFVEVAGSFEARPVEVGRRSRIGVEIVSGLVPGDRYVAAGGFSLKAELGKDAFGDGHGH